jgi:uncharacterized protein YcbK (DUF882 family)
MGDISKNFSRREFACKCGCGFEVVDVELLRVLEEVRERFGPVKITSGCRCLEHNRKVGGTLGSEHTRGIAADFVVPGVSPEVIAGYLRDTYPGRYGIGEYADWVHLDMRPRFARWRKWLTS